MKYQLGKNYVVEETSNCLGKMLIISGLSFPVSLGASVHVLGTCGIIAIVMIISLDVIYFFLLLYNFSMIYGY